MQFAQEKKIETHANDSYATILFDYNIYPVNPFIPALNFNYYMLNERPLNFGFALELIPMLHYKRDQHDYVNVAFQKAFTCLCEKYSHFIRYEKLLSAAKHRFYLPTRQITRGSIGLFYEILIRENDPQISYYIFNFIKDLHKTILLFYHHIIVKNIGVDWTLQDKKEQLFFRSICAEYYLFTDRNIVENMILGTCKAALLEKMPPLLVRQTI
ncbi:coproporphyrinogen III oxidase [Bartonella sp. DGB1]|uniref:coproporphyrinogen III oxidase n=1 Tax=Bartonella sp. DGB1 TaxID=3239807 RepID=UPI0035250497